MSSSFLFCLNQRCGRDLLTSLEAGHPSPNPTVKTLEEVLYTRFGRIPGLVRWDVSMGRCHYILNAIRGLRCRQGGQCRGCGLFYIRPGNGDVMTHVPGNNARSSDELLPF